MLLTDRITYCMQQLGLYADDERGRYPVWQSLAHAGLLPGSGVMMVTVTVSGANHILYVSLKCTNSWTGRILETDRVAS